MSGEMTADEFQSLTGVSRETMDKFICYSDMLVKWQKSINLVSSSTISDMWRRHFYDSAQLLSFLEKKKEPLKILDIGSGAGFPGLVLSILGAGEIHLVESVGKKCAFMKQIIQKTDINAIVHNKRIEELEPFQVDLVTSRACAELGKLLQLASPFIKNETECLFLKGEKADEEITRAFKKWCFKVKKHNSKSEESGMILCISEIKGC